MTGLSVTKHNSLITRINIKGIGEVVIRNLILRSLHIINIIVVDHLIPLVHLLQDNGMTVGMTTRVGGATAVTIHHQRRPPAVVHIVTTIMITVVTGSECHMMNHLKHVVSRVTEETGVVVGKTSCMMMEELRAGIVVKNTCTNLQIERSSTKVVNSHFQLVSITLDRKSITSHMLYKNESSTWTIEVIVAHRWKGLV